MTSPKVSICVPTYNGREHLRACLESIQAQTFRDFEVIIADDNSPDQTLDFAHELTQGDSRFRLIANPRRFGLVGNWNNCLEVARGEWIKFVFQDDLIAPTCLASLLTACEREGQPFGFCRRRILFEGDVAPETRAFFDHHEQFIETFYGDKPYIDAATFARKSAENPNFNLIGEPTVVLFNRSVVERFGAFNSSLIQLCDSEYWNRVATNTGVVNVPEYLATFRIHATSTTSHNASHRRYRHTQLDPLVTNYQLLRDVHYQNLRRAFYECFGQRKAWRGLYSSAYSAWRSSHPYFLNFGSRSSVLRQEWASITQTYPRLRLYALAGFFLALRRAALPLK